ncbi:MAG TPA: shikimate kinase [Phycisphaerae bacterium]|nr:shikimate kinase [Phycisphaerae bacterium]
MNIVLIGYRGSGKTTIGRALARRLGWGFVDTDVEIVGRAGMTIREIFEREGEAGFRDRESAVVRDVAARGGRGAAEAGLVVAAGGGAVLRVENVAALKATGKVVWLKAPVEVLHERISADAATAAMRPNLTAAGGLEEIRALLAVREEAYRGAADEVLEVGGMGVEEAVDRLAGGNGESERRHAKA